MATACDTRRDSGKGRALSPKPVIGAGPAAVDDDLDVRPDAVPLPEEAPMLRTATLMLAALLAIAFATEALADPPPWAPAHGYRSKDKGKGKDKRRDRDGERYWVGYSGNEYSRDFDVVEGRCNREQVGAVLGGVVGGVVGNQVGSRDNRTVATIIGVAVGALIGAKVGRDMDDRDRACLGQALELGASGRRVAWTNETTGVRYELVPADGRRDGGPVCRDFRLSSIQGRERRDSDARACQSRPGVWELSRG
jgi:surface antigen